MSLNTNWTGRAQQASPESQEPVGLRPPPQAGKWHSSHCGFTVQGHWEDMHCPLRAASDINATRQEEAGNLCLRAERGNVKAAGASAIIQGDLYHQAGSHHSRSSSICPVGMALAASAESWSQPQRVSTPPELTHGSLMPCAMC